MAQLTVEELVTNITDFVNTYSLNSNSFCESMSREHRTLQQSFTKLCLKWIEYCASDEYKHDPRNQSSHETAKTLIALFKEMHGNNEPSNYLPLI